MPLTFDVDTSQDWAVTWTVQEPMARSCHALAHEGRVWLVDPLTDDEALDAAESLGQVAGVLQLLDRHARDCEALARRYDVPHLRLPEQLPDTPFQVSRMVWLPGWRELSLWVPAQSALVVAESAGTGAYFALAGKPAGIHPMLRLRPPGELRRHRPRHLMTGHGPSLHDGAADALDEALSRSITDIPRVPAAMVSAYR